MTEQIINGRNGLVLLGCHQAMVMKRTGDLYPLVRLPVSLMIYWPLDILYKFIGIDCSEYNQKHTLQSLSAAFVVVHSCPISSTSIHLLLRNPPPATKKNIVY